MANKPTPAKPKQPCTLRQKLRRGGYGGLILLVVFWFGWRQWRVARVPEVELFDREAFVAEIVRERGDLNAYREASELLQEAENRSDGQIYHRMSLDLAELNPPLKEGLQPEELARIENYIPAIEAWLSTKNAGNVVWSQLSGGNNEFDLATDIISLNYLTSLRNQQLISEGKHAQAFANCESAYVIVANAGGAGIANVCYPHIGRQLVEVLTSKEIGIDDIRGCQATLRQLTPALMDAEIFIKGYCLQREAEAEELLEDRWLANWLTNEPEVVRRVQQQIAANWLRHDDNSFRDRPEVITHHMEREPPEILRWLEQRGLPFPEWESQDYFVSYYRASAADDKLVDYTDSLMYSDRGIGNHWTWLAEWNRVRDTVARSLQRHMIILAMHGYHRSHGEFPKELEELVPEWLPEVPVASTEGKPPRIELINGGTQVVLLHVGDEKMIVVAPR